jgi:Protein of unknown function (DUF3303)
VLFMVVEDFTREGAKAVYKRARREGRMLPEGLRYVDSWVQADLGGCFQLMECDDVGPLQEWIARWSDLVEFEVFPVAPSAVTADLMSRQPS